MGDDLQINLDFQDDAKAKKRAKKAAEKKAKAFESMEDAWKRILEMKNTDLDRERLLETKRAWEKGQITREDTNKRFSKAEALRMYVTVREMFRQEKLDEMVRNTPDNYRLIQTVDQFEEMLGWLKREPIIALDTETTGVDVYNDEMVGISITFPKADIHVYIPFGHDEGEQLDRDYVLRELKPYLTNKHLKKVLHNAKFDFHMFLRYGIRVRGLEMDTMVAMWTLNENEPTYRLKDLAEKYHKYLGIPKENDTFAELFGKDCKFNTVPLKYALVYAAKDTLITWRLYCFIRDQLNRPGLEGVRSIYYDLENALVDVCVDMEQTGFCVDFAFAKKYGKRLQHQIHRIERNLVRIFGEINYNSPVQLQKVLYDDLGLPDVSGKRSTDAETLEKLQHEHKGVKLLLMYRELTKLLGTYVDKLPQIVKGDNRVHGSFNQSATVTGRFASKEPNLQNLPGAARKLFVAPVGWLILGSDFSQIEPRVLAHMSGDKNLMAPYLEGRDLYSTLASRVFNKPIEQCGDGSKYRKMMKTGLLAVMYGTSMFTLSKQLKITVEEAEKFIEDFYESYPDVEAFIRATWEFAKENEYVATMYGRKRRFPGHKQDAIAYDKTAAEICAITKTKKVPLNFWKIKEIPYDLKRRFQDVKGRVERVRRMAVNARIQGTAADIMKRAMINLNEYALSKGWYTAGTVHDEALLQVPRTITREEVAEVESCMTSAASLSVPLKVDVELMERWGEGVSKNQWFASAA